jgi:predicted RNA binding protein YcfA (HicA-like mRNA interferase family)
VLGYQIVRQSGSHMRLMTTQNGVHHLTIPHHNPLKVGLLLGGILNLKTAMEDQMPEASQLLAGG